jgi:hypothetical protein
MSGRVTAARSRKRKQVMMEPEIIDGESPGSNHDESDPADRDAWAFGILTMHNRFRHQGGGVDSLNADSHVALAPCSRHPQSRRTMTVR